MPKNIATVPIKAWRLSFWGRRYAATGGRPEWIKKLEKPAKHPRTRPITGGSFFEGFEDNKGQTLVSEGIDANYFDMINYSIFALIKLSEKWNF